MLDIEALQSGGAWQAAIKGSLPADLSSLSGPVTDLPAKIGAQLVKLSDAVKVFEDLSAGNAASIIGAVVAAIKAVVGSIVKAADKRERNWAEARLWYLANVRGVRQTSSLYNFFGSGGKAGDWRYPRASVAKDRAIPYWDPLGTSGNLPKFLVPYDWASPDYKGPHRWPGVGNWLPDDCTSWSAIGLGAKCSGPTGMSGGPDVYDPHETINLEICTIVAWPWAYPLCSPSRLAGLWGKSSEGPETAVASLYMLPSPQHIDTKSADVADSKRLLLLALERWFPEAYLAGPGDWRNTGKSVPSGVWSRGEGGGIVAPDGGYAGVGVSFEILAGALARIEGFERCRAAILEAPHLLPEDLRKLLKGNPDFAGASIPNGSHGVNSLHGTGGISGGSGGSGTGAIVGGALVLGGAALAAYMWRRRRK